MLNSGNQTTNHTTPSTDANRPFILEGHSGRQEPGGVFNFRSQNDKNVNIDADRQTGYERSNKLESDPGNGFYAETLIPANKTHATGKKEFVSGSNELGSSEKRGTMEADYGNRGSIGTGLAGAITGTQHQRRTSDIDAPGFRGGIGLNKAVEHRAEHIVIPTENVIKESHQLDSDRVENVTRRVNEASFREQEFDPVPHVVQHGAQSLTGEKAQDDVHREKVNIITNVRETSDETDDETHGQPQHHKDSRDATERERAIIDKGESISEREIHHVHHIIQPIINKETIEQHRIHTTIPIHQVTHEAPIIHKSQTHAPVSMEHFAQRGGQITGGLTCDQIGRNVLQSGECTRQVNGEGDKIARELTGSGLPGAGGHFGRHLGEGRVDLDKERLGDKGVLRSGTCASSSRTTSTSMNKRGESTSMLGSQGNAIDPHGDHNNSGQDVSDDF
ncbi:hypothetical protein C0992_000472 [Termitomyces sp. T32_za158]|nr:hypothetical protein C0992_000472 [Termitomyces sp. T32_za158]